MSNQYFCCNICGAMFQSVTTEEQFDTDKTATQLESHQQKCTTDSPYLDDPNAVMYPPTAQ